MLTSMKEQIETQIQEQYRIIEYLGGHYPTGGCDAQQLKNPMWKVDTGDVHKLIMYCESDTLCILCDTSYKAIIQFEETECDGKKLTFYKGKNGYIMSHVPKLNKILYIHQIIMNHYGNGRGTKTSSIDHIDRNPHNNTMDNLRIASREEQEQNSKGIAQGTKRERQKCARELPEGIDQSMLRKYVVYYLNTYNKEKNKTREYFRVEHPALETPWESSKSEKVSIREKLDSANRVAEDLEQGIYPEKTAKVLPKHVSIMKRSDGKSCLVFDKRGLDGVRYNIKMVYDESGNLEDEIARLKEKLAAKYPDIERN